jgi:RNA polymerase sigma-70 factor, ECF subfamily
MEPQAPLRPLARQNATPRLLHCQTSTYAGHVILYERQFFTMFDSNEDAQEAAWAQDVPVLAALRDGDEAEFSRLVRMMHLVLSRIAARYAGSAAVTEEIVQEAWLVFVEQLDRFEGRSSIKTWLVRIVLNCARNRKRKELRCVPFSSMSDVEMDGDPVVARSQFQTDGLWMGHWAVAPKSFAEDGERLLLRGELRAFVEAAVDALPLGQREVLVLRDIEGFSSTEVCEVLNISETNQRVLLHRARGHVRTHVAAYLDRQEHGS